MIDAIILAGGKGSRICSDLPKPLVQLFGKPLISHQIEYLEKFPMINNIIVSLGYKSDTVAEYLRVNHSSSRLVLSIENEPMGTGGGMHKAMNYVTTKMVFAMNVDNISDINLKELARTNKTSIVISKGARNLPYGKVEIHGQYATFIEKPPIDYWTSTGWYLFDSEYIRKHLPTRGSLEKDVLPNIRISPFKHLGNIWSLNSIKDIKNLEKEQIVR